MFRTTKYVPSYAAVGDLPYNVPQYSMANVGGVLYVKTAKVGGWTQWTLVSAGIAALAVGTAALAALAVTTAKIADGAVTLAKIAANSLDATIAKNLASGDVIAGLTTTFMVNIADASADTDIVVTHKVRVIDFKFRSSGIAAHLTNDTVQLKNGATAITDAVAKTATAKSLVRCSTIDSAQEVVNAGGTLRVTAVKATNVAGTAYITCVRSA